ncbi:MAG: formylglycine-generating enzyme family protein, partial [Planctomycetota bacterium]
MAQLRFRRFGPNLILAFACLTAVQLDAQIKPRRIGNGSSNGKASKPILVEAPRGYPPDLVVVKRGLVELGIDYKTVFNRSRKLSSNPNRQRTIRKLLARELGRERLTLPDFFIGRHEVTNEQYATFLKTINAKEKRVKFPFSWWDEENKEKITNAFREKWKGEKAFKPLEYWDNHWTDLEWKMPEGKEKFPVNYITFEAAQAYCAWAGMRLPTEPEWQRAYYGEKRQCYVLGAEWKKDWLKIIQLDNPRNRKLKPVGSIPEIRSVFGADDLLGNVWEWTQSPFEQFEGFQQAFNALNRLLQRQKNKRLKGEVVVRPEFSANTRVLKGGSYRCWPDPELSFRAYNRNAKADHIAKEDLGFRVAKSRLPTLDAATLWARIRFDATALGESRLDLPSARDVRAMRSGKQRTYELRGM